MNEVFTALTLVGLTAVAVYQAFQIMRLESKVASNDHSIQFLADAVFPPVTAMVEPTPTETVTEVVEETPKPKAKKAPKAKAKTAA